MKQQSTATYDNANRKQKTELFRLSEFESRFSKVQHRAFLNKHLPHVNVELDAADETWLLLDEETIAGHFSLWYCETPALNGKTTGFVGHYYAKNGEVGKQLLDAASGLLKEYGCEFVVGPVDGNTWRRYRLVCGTTTVPRFLMEPENPMEYPGHFIESGFEAIATYSSSIMDVQPQFLDAAKTEASPEESRILSRVTIRPVDLDNFENELHTIYGIACDAFGDAFLYAEISELEFIARYNRLRQIVNPELVLIAEYNKHAVGFILAVPDPANSNSSIKTVIAKTIGRIKDDRFRGLGALLMAECHRRADKLGFSRMIQALYKDDNSSSIYSTLHNAHVFRKYAVYGKQL
jgi:L-amino acid N-acyltransferase YncA